MIADDARLTPPCCKKHTGSTGQTGRRVTFTFTILYMIADDTRLTPPRCKKHTASFARSTGKFPSITNTSRNNTHEPVHNLQLVYSVITNNTRLQVLHVPDKSNLSEEVFIDLLVLWLSGLAIKACHPQLRRFWLGLGLYPTGVEF